MNRSNAFFLDTSSQIARHWDLPEIQEEIQAELADNPLYCCVYVLQQYKATLLNALIVLYDLLRYTDSVTEAMARSERPEWRRRAFGTGKEAEGKRIRQAAHCFFRMHPDKLPTKQEVLERLEKWIEDGWEDFFFDGFHDTELVDTTGCTRAADAPKRSPEGYYFPVDATCNKEDPRDCKIREFWENNKEDLRKLSKIDYNSLPRGKVKAQMQKLQEHAGKILESEKETRQGQRCSVHMSDAIITIESRCTSELSTVHTTDNDFEPIGKCLNVKVHVYRYNLNRSRLGGKSIKSAGG